VLKIRRVLGRISANHFNSFARLGIRRVV